MQPRPYQSQIIQSVEAGWKDYRKQLVVLATGGGKTPVFSWLAQRIQPERTLILAHREELIDQAIDKLRQATGIRADKEKAEHRASLSAPVVVASVQSMQGERLLRWPANHFGLVVADEAHHSISDSWQSPLRHFDQHAKVLGVTATSDRGDKRNLGEYYESVAAEIGLFDLIKQGYLSRVVIKSIPLEISLSNVGQSKGDYDVNDLDDALTPYLGAVAQAIAEHAPFRKTLVFLPLIATSKKMVEACEAVGLQAMHVDGYCEDRKDRLNAFASGKFDVACNSALLGEGYDDPSIDCVVILRPTRSRPLYAQLCGRGTRLFPGKENLLLLDFLWMHTKHNLVRPAHLIAKTQEEAEVITKIAEEESKPGGQGELDLEGLATAATEKRHEALRKKLEENRKKKGKLIDAMEYAMREGKADLVDYEPVMKWESHPVTEPQARALKRNGIDPATVTGKGHAMRLLDVAFGKQKLLLASEGQRRVMRRMGVANWESATQEEARRFFSGLRREKAA